jgi:hypothetical protein
LWNFHSSVYYKVGLVDGGRLDIFIRKKYLCWLEALSLCRRISEGVLPIAKLETAIKVILG